MVRFAGFSSARTPSASNHRLVYQYLMARYGQRDNCLICLPVEAASRPSARARMRRFFTSIVVAMFWLAAGTSPGTALENLRVFRGVLILEGKIELGDYLSVRNFLRDESNFKKISGGVFLASPGGSVLEALKIGRLIRELRLSTEAPASPPPDRRDISAPLIRGRDLSNPERLWLCQRVFFSLRCGYLPDAELGRPAWHS